MATMPTSAALRGIIPPWARCRFTSSNTRIFYSSSSHFLYASRARQASEANSTTTTTRPIPTPSIRVGSRRFRSVYDTTTLQPSTANIHSYKAPPPPPPPPSPPPQASWTPPAKGILSKLPPSLVPYAELSRIEKPGGLFGFYMAYLIGLSYGACVATPAPDMLFLAGTAGKLLVYNFFLRGAACTVNDILDRDYDRQVARCKTRPVARGAVTPAQAYAWYGVQTLGAAAALATLPDPLAMLAYAVPIQLVVSLYPLGKRYTHFPQLILSAPIAGGALMAAAAIGVDPFVTALSSPSSACVAAATTSLFLSHYVWTTIFDYVNACQDTADDVKAGVRGMAVRYQDTQRFISVLGAAQVACLAATGVLAGFSPIYFVGAAGGNALWLAAMVKTVRRSRPDICGWWFSWGGLLVSGTTVLALLAEYVWGSGAGRQDAEGEVSSSSSN